MFKGLEKQGASLLLLMAGTFVPGARAATPLLDDKIIGNCKILIQREKDQRKNDPNYLNSRPVYVPPICDSVRTEPKPTAPESTSPGSNPSGLPNPSYSDKPPEAQAIDDRLKLKKEIDSKLHQREEYAAAEKLAGKATISNGISTALWAVSAGFCATNCIHWMHGLDIARTNLLADLQAINAIADAKSATAVCLAPATKSVIVATLATAQANYAINAQEMALASVPGPVAGGGPAAISKEPELSLSTQLKTQTIALDKAIAADAAKDTAACGASGGAFGLAAGAAYATCDMTCKGFTANLVAANTKLKTSIAAYDTELGEVESNGLICSGINIAAAGGDAALSLALAKDKGGAMLGAMGAAPGLIGLVAANMGKSAVTGPGGAGMMSCVSAVVSGGLAVMKGLKIMEAMKDKKKSGDMLQKLDSDVDSLDQKLDQTSIAPGLWRFIFRTDTQVAHRKKDQPSFGSSSGSRYRGLEVALSLGSGLFRPFLSCAHAATATTQNAADFGKFLSACEGSLATFQSKLSCAAAGDQGWKQILQESSQPAEALEQYARRDLGGSLNELIKPTQPFSMEQLASMMTVRDRSRAPQMLQALKDMQSEGANRLKIKVLPETQLGSNPFAQSAPTPLGAPAPIGAPALDPGTAPAAPLTADRQPGALPGAIKDPLAPSADPEFGINPQESLFKVVSRRYQLSADKIERLEWSTPYNRSVNGLGSVSGASARTRTN